MPAKILIVAGPNRGATYFLSEGENYIGRGSDCQIALQSAQVSKRHCTLVSTFDGRKVELEDIGSSNGTFVNGILAKKKVLQNQDRISVGPFVLQIFLPATRAVARPARAAMPESQEGMTGFTQAPGISMSMEPAKEEPKSLIPKLKQRFDETVLPVMYSFYEKYDFPTIFVTMFVIFVLLNIGFTVSPVIERSREEVLREAEARAVYIAEVMAMMNRQAILERRETALNIDFVDLESNVKEAAILNMDARIMAPATRFNEMYSNPKVIKYKDRLLAKQRDPAKYPKFREEGAVTVVVPIMVLSKTMGINVPGALAVVNLSTESISLDSATRMAIYFETLMMTTLLGVFFLYLLYQLTFQPIRMLNDELDKALKGGGTSVEKRYKSEVINALIDTVNSALSRIPSATNTGDAATPTGDMEQLAMDNLMRSVEFMASKITGPLMLLDAERRIKFVNPGFEELTGIRGAVGDVIENVSRDESFPSLVKEMMDKARTAGAEGVVENYDFNSGTHKIHAVGLNGVPDKVEGFLFLFEKAEG